MKSTNWKDFAELVGIAAIVGSLIFVGLQMRQEQEIALSQAYQLRTELTVSLNLAVMQSPQTLSAIAKSRTDRMDEVTVEESVAACKFFVSSMYVVENSFYQTKDGFLTNDHWSRVRNMIKVAFRTDPFMSLCADEYLAQARDEFRHELETIRAESEIAD